jgi:hypothetical protein
MFKLNGLANSGGEGLGGCDDFLRIARGSTSRRRVQRGLDWHIGPWSGAPRPSVSEPRNPHPPYRPEPRWHLVTVSPVPVRKPVRTPDVEHR